MYKTIRLPLLLSLLFLYSTICSADDLPDAEQLQRDSYLSTPITVTGRLIDTNNQPVANAIIKLTTSSIYETASDENGFFQLTDIIRQNGLLKINHIGYRQELISLYVQYPITQQQLNLQPIILNEKNPQQVRFLFGGDTSFARRFLDPDEKTPRDQIPINDPDALIQVSDPLPGSQRVAQLIQPYYQEADWGVLNFESAATLNPSTPHLEKDFAYFTLPESLSALTWLGIDYVSLGNNHLYDYLDIGVIDTINTLDTIGIYHSGAGLNNTQAFQAFHQHLAGDNYAFLSMTSVSGNKHSISYVAEQNKGGAADLNNDTETQQAIQREKQAGYITIAQLHGGKEYTFEPSSYFTNRMQLVAEANADLIIGHHPHVAQGIGLINNKVAIHSLGNLIFDQDRLETMLGLLARVDMQAADVKQVRFLPVYIEDYQPSPIGGNLADVFLRRIAEFSHNYGALVYPYNSQGWVTFDSTQVISNKRYLDIEIEIPESGFTVIDLRQYLQPGESLSSLNTRQTGLVAKLGRDLMQHGDFEDWDNDQMQFEAARWDHSKFSVYVCSDNVYNGIAAICSRRSEYSELSSIIAFRNRIRIMGDGTEHPNKQVSFLAYSKAENAGAIRIVGRYYASAGNKQFGEEVIYSHIGGDFDWQPIIQDFEFPQDITSDAANGIDNPRALRIFLHQEPVTEGNGLVRYDDIAIINWEDEIDLSTVNDLITPHAKDFIRIQGKPGEYAFKLGFTAYEPKLDQFVDPAIEANNQDVLWQHPEQAVNITMSLQQQGYNETVMEWWVDAATPFGHFYYVYPGTWVTEARAAIQYPLLNLSSVNLFSGHLPPGDYVFTFCIDPVLDNIKQCQWQDQLNVMVFQ